LTEMHPIPQGQGMLRMISDCSGSVRSWLSPRFGSRTAENATSALSLLGLSKQTIYGLGRKVA
jgi:hypothetical protein